MTIGKVLVLGVKVGAIVLVLLIVGVIGAYWWANAPPNRPANAASKAVWLWSPSVGLPAPKRGIWVGCSQEAALHCRMTDKDGRQLYEGVFLPYSATNPISYGELDVDAERTQRDFPERSLFLDNELVPIVYLRSGEVLIPAAKYDQGKRMVDTARKAH